MCACSIYVLCSAAPNVWRPICLELSNHSYPSTYYHRSELVISSVISDILFVPTWNIDALLPGRVSFAAMCTCDSRALQRTRVKLIRLAVSGVKILDVLLKTRHPQFIQSAVVILVQTLRGNVGRPIDDIPYPALSSKSLILISYPVIVWCRSSLQLNSILRHRPFRTVVYCTITNSGDLESSRSIASSFWQQRGRS